MQQSHKVSEFPQKKAFVHDPGNGNCQTSVRPRSDDGETESTNNRPSGGILTFAVIFAVIILTGLIVYLPRIGEIGMYRDDWINYFNAVMRGPDFLVQHYSTDRPADGYLLAIIFRLFGTDNTAYLIYNLVCRLIGSCAFAAALILIFPDHAVIPLFAGIFSVVFPGFLQQIEGISYVPHQTAMCAYMISLLLTAAALKTKSKIKTALLTVIAAALELYSVSLMEYYIGMEIARFLMIWHFSCRQRKNLRERLPDAVKLYIPYLIAAAAFLVWRVWMFDASRAGANVSEDIFEPFKARPRRELLDLFIREIKNCWKLFAGCWTIPVYNLLNGIDRNTFLSLALPGCAVLAVTAAGIVYVQKFGSKENSLIEEDNIPIHLLLSGLCCGSISVFPLVLSKHDITFSMSLDRFSFVGMIGSILFLLGILFFIRSKAVRTAAVLFIVTLSVFVQIQNKTGYINQWNMMRSYWQQLIWRAPMIAEGTTIVSGGSLLAEEDYDIYAPANFIYYPNEKGDIKIGAEVLNSNTIQDIVLGRQDKRETRKIIVEKDYTRLLAITKPSDTACLRVIDGRAPIYSKDDWTKIPQVGSYSKIERIMTGTAGPEQPFFLGSEAEHGWCYYYEKMELSLQTGDSETAAGLADSAKELGLRAGDSVELLPMIEAYAYEGRTSDAIDIAEQIKDDEYMSHEVCLYYRDRSESTFDFLEDFFCN